MPACCKASLNRKLIDLIKSSFLFKAGFLLDAEVLAPYKYEGLVWRVQRLITSK